MEEKKKIMKSIYANTSRELIKNCNELNIKQEDIVSIIHTEDYYTMFYYE